MSTQQLRCPAGCFDCAAGTHRPNSDPTGPYEGYYGLLDRRYSVYANDVGLSDEEYDTLAKSCNALEDEMIIDKIERGVYEEFYYSVVNSNSNPATPPGHEADEKEGEELFFEATDHGRYRLGTTRNVDERADDGSNISGEAFPPPLTEEEMRKIDAAFEIAMRVKIGETAGDNAVALGNNPTSVPSRLSTSSLGRATLLPLPPSPPLLPVRDTAIAPTDRENRLTHKEGSDVLHGRFVADKQSFENEDVRISLDVKTQVRAQYVSERARRHWKLVLSFFGFGIRKDHYDKLE